MFFGYNDISTFLIALVAIVLSIMLHEVAHGLVALWNGDDTAKRAGRLNLNPVSHFDPVGFLMLIFLRFGYAKPVPVNPYNFKNRKVGMFTVSVAGVTLNLILAFFCYPLFVVCSEINYLKTFLLYMVVVNLNLAAFNLLPLYPSGRIQNFKLFYSGNQQIHEFFEKLQPLYTDILACARNNTRRARFAALV